MYGAAIHAASFFSPKAARWVHGRQKLFENLKNESKAGKPVWFHCASLGEFEQARPLIELIKDRHPDCDILLSFFSPSGYEIRKNYALASYVTYLPLDTPSNARRFVELVKPRAAFFVRYDLWHNHLRELHSRLIPMVLFSGSFRAGQPYFKWYGGLFRQTLHFFNQIFVLNETSHRLLNRVGVRAALAYDTRFDRVVAIARNRKVFPEVEKFCSGHRVMIAGSTWANDEELIKKFYNKFPDDWKLILAPHQPEQKALHTLKKSFGDDAVLYSEFDGRDSHRWRVLLIDHIGNLSSLYAYAHLAYIGGGFNTGVHNILEAAVYGIPVVFGKKFHRSAEAIDLLRIGGAVSVNNRKSFDDTLLKLLQDNELRARMGALCAEYVQQHTGGTEQIYLAVKKYFA